MSAVQNFINKRFFGKKSLRPKGKALLKDKVEKKRAELAN